MATLAASAPQPLKGDCYKYEWARYVAKRTLDDDLNAVKSLILQLQANNTTGINLPDIPNDLKKTNITELYKITEDYTGGGIIPPQEDKFKIAIVGAGVSGLFTALLFDWLNEHPKLKGKLKIDYEIIEAAKESRVGGRLFSHRFSEAEHDYYDVGAMRFPENEVMNRTFRLFKYLALEKNTRGGLVPYYLDDVNNVCPSIFNDIRTVGNIWKDLCVKDPYQLNSGLPRDGKIPEKFLTKSPSELSSEAFSTVINDVQGIMDKLRNVDGHNAASQSDWATLMAMDKMSVRQFFSSVDNGKDANGNPLPRGPGYNFNTTEWLECATFGTGWYDQSLTEAILEELDFELPKDKGFWCVDGGAQKIAELMRKKVKGPIRFDTQVTAINANRSSPHDIKDYVPMTLSVTETGHENPKKDHDYLAVFNSTTLGALQRMDLRNAGLLWGTKQAIRALNYGASCKVAIKFKSPWWQLKPYNINKGGLARTDLPLRVCVYPSYNIKSPENPNWNPEASSVLLCSYTWGQDASRLGALITPDSPAGEEQLKEVALHNLALLHAQNPEDYQNVLDMLQKEYETHHAYDWYKDQTMAGAFAYFGPGQFSNMWQEIIKPNAFGQLYMIGEAASAHHGWIVGALESVVRAVFVMLEGLHHANPEFVPYQDAMEILIDKDGLLELPFQGLPLEMPMKQFDTKKGAELSDHPKTGGSELTYPAAMAALCQVESLVQKTYEEVTTAEPTREGENKFLSQSESVNQSMASQTLATETRNFTSSNRMVQGNSAH